MKEYVSPFEKKKQQIKEAATEGLSVGGVNFNPEDMDMSNNPTISGESDNIVWYIIYSIYDKNFQVEWFESNQEDDNFWDNPNMKDFNGLSEAIGFVERNFKAEIDPKIENAMINYIGRITAGYIK